MMRLVFLVSFLRFLMDVGLTVWAWPRVSVGMRVCYTEKLSLTSLTLISGLWNMLQGNKPSKQSIHSAIRILWVDLSMFEK